MNAETKYGIIFNPDIIVDIEPLDGLVEAIKAQPELASVSPRVLNEDGSTQHLVRDDMNVFDLALRFVPFGFVKKMFDKRLARFEKRDLPTDVPSYIRMASGCFIVIDLDKFRSVGGFDENRYFLYFEDNDLSKKILAAGF
jgi:GT2 family glycosyltransferase